MFVDYISKYIKNTDKFQTHLSFNRGKYNVPDDSYEEFYKKYYEAILNKEDVYLIEKVHKCNFAFFYDIDSPKTNKSLTDKDVTVILQNTVEIVEEIFESVNAEYIVSKRDNKYHVNFPNIVVNSQLANLICKKLFEVLPNDIQNVIDTSVYRTGLRMLGSQKSPVKADKRVSKCLVYMLYDLATGSYMSLNYDLFVKTIVRRKVVEKISTLNSKYEGFNVPEQQKHVVDTTTVKNAVSVDIAKLFLNLKKTNEHLKSFDLDIVRIHPAKNRLGMFCYYISVSEKFCPFQQRPHKRENSPIYIEISINGICVKCYDSDCLKRKFPEEGIPLPKNFEMDYPELHKSMSTQYWSAEVNITADTRQLLEESLSGSHYQIAKAAFNIFKDKFRVDDIKNTAWYEYDGVRWKKSHLMNILISEELPKYYKGIKIRDTSRTNTDLQEFIKEEDKFDSNLRNQMVDNIVCKLENVNFKNNVLSQLTYIFKNYDLQFYENLDENPYIIGFKNGVYDFNKNVFRNAEPNDYITFSTNYDYIDYDESDDNVKEIYSFLEKIITSKNVREYLLKVLGKSLVGVPEERFYIWTGLSGANGKSTLVNFLEQTLGDYITSVDVSLLTNKRASSGNASPDIIRLKGKRLFTFQEPEHDDKLRTGILKQFTGGDTIIARELFKAPITFKLQGTMVMCCNDLPHVASIDGGTWRRIRVIEFNSRFCENPTKKNEFHIDPTIKSKMKGWRPYFMSILIHWYNKYLFEGMNEPNEVVKATCKYKADNDKFNEYFDQCIEEVSDSDNDYVTIKTVHGDFTSWWSSNYPTSKIPDIKELRRAMKIKYGNEREKRLNGLLCYGFNVRIKSGPMDDYDDGEM
jgi:P4 family phage/plasmid primase-like protien